MGVNLVYIASKSGDNKFDPSWPGLIGLKSWLQFVKSFKFFFFFWETKYFKFVSHYAHYIRTDGLGFPTLVQNIYCLHFTIYIIHI